MGVLRARIIFARKPFFLFTEETTMQRREFLKKAAVGAAAGAVATPVLSQQQQAVLPTISWRLPSSFPKSLDTLFGGADQFTKRVAQMTGNKFQIRAFAAGEIVPPLQVLDLSLIHISEPTRPY